MIVKCEKCQTRFKIPDEKVTEKGVKVRCTRCQNTFRVYRAQHPAAAPAAPPLGPPPTSAPRPDTDPFARFGLPEGPPPLEATRPGVFPEGIAATRPPLAPSFSAQSDLPAEVFDQPTRIAKVPKALLEDPVPPPPASPSPPEPDSATARAASGLLDLPPADEAKAPSPEFDEPTAPGKFAAGLLGELPPPDESFAALPSDGPDRGLFDMSAQAAATVPQPPDAAAGEPRAPASASASAAEAKAESELAAAADAAAVEKPAGRPEDVGMAEASRPGTVRRTAGLVANLAIASVLVVVLLSVGTIYLNGGKLDPSALSLEPLKALFSSPGALLAVDVSNGLYDTRGGKPVFYVRGEVENRGQTPTRARVRVDILDGTTSVTRAEALAGQAPNPEELFQVNAASELAALGAKLDAAAVEVKPGERVPFLVAFYDYPPQLGDYRLKVTVQEQAGKAAAP